MNRAQRRIGWVFVIIIAVVLLLGSFANLGSPRHGDSGVGMLMLVLSLGLVGVWAFIAAGSKGDE